MGTSWLQPSRWRKVIADVNDIILRYLTVRIARRYGLEQKP